MYLSYFDLKELPFSIAPNPDYLFMSDRHREALNHLTYGLGETGGFVLLTGEVGTGKTTVSRCLMEQIPDNTQVAFILNPTLSAHELLATLCDELCIEYDEDKITLKGFTDKIQKHLLANHEAGKNTLLLIDEAQHLLPDVLEQLRLLTNLETNTKKLLQVILIGQPELQTLLQRQDLRQLAQRITARYHLMPLTLPESKQYIQHRLDVAKAPRMLFEESAVKQIHKLSTGIPRLMNLLCDKSLMLAYQQNQSMVNRKVVTQASNEVLGSAAIMKQAQKRDLPMPLIATAASILIAVGGIGYWMLGQQEQTLQTLNQVEKELTETQSQLELSKVSAELERVKQQQETLAVIDENAKQVSEMLNVMGKLREDQQETQAELNRSKQNVSQLERELAVQKQRLREADNMQVVNGQPKSIPDFNVDDIEGVSPELLALVQQAVDDTNEEIAQESIQSPAPAQQPESNYQVETRSFDAKPLTVQPQWLQNAVPPLNFEMHMYASNNQGWVKVNGEEKSGGDWITDNLQLVSVERKVVVLSYDGYDFTLPSLSSWQ